MELTSANQIITSLVSVPGAVASIVSALIAATVALLVLALTQYLTFKKDRKQFLTPKLEELYLLLNEITEQNVAHFKLVCRSIEGDQESIESLRAMDDLELYGHRRAKKMVMLIRLYFPRLAGIHQRLFAAERELNELKFAAASGEQIEVGTLVRSSGRIGHFVRLMEEEMVRNCDLLISANLFPTRYRAISETEIASETPPPPGILADDGEKAIGNAKSDEQN